MGGFGSGFLEGLANTAREKLDEKHRREQEEKDAERRMYQSVWLDRRLPEEGGPSQEERDYAQSQLAKRSGKETKTGIQRIGDIFSKIRGDGKAKELPQQQRNAQQPGQQPQQGTPQAPQQGVFTENMPNGQPAPGTAGASGKLPAPATPAPQATSQSSQTQIPNVPSQIPQGAAQQMPMPAQRGRLPTPSTPASASGIAGMPMMTVDQRRQMILDAQKRQADIESQQTQAKEKAKTEADFNKWKQEQDYKAEQATKERKAAFDEIENSDLSDEEKHQAKIKLFGVTETTPGALRTIHVQKTDGTWSPALENTKTGEFVGLDKKPIPADQIKDVRPEPPAPEKDEQEVKTLTQFFEEVKGMNHADARKAALTQRKKELDTKEKGVEVRIATAQSTNQSDATDDELRALANREITTGKSPSFGLGKSKDRSKYNKILAQEIAGNPDYAQALAEFKAGTATVSVMRKMEAQIGAFEKAFESDLENARDASRDVPRSSMKKFNSIKQLITSDWSDDPELARLAVATQATVNAYSRIISSATASGISTDASRKEAEAILNKAMAPGAFSATLDQMKKEAENRVEGINSQIEQTKKRMSGKSSTGSASKLPSPGQVKTAEDYLKKHGF